MTASGAATTVAAAATGGGLVLATLAAGQFLMTLDSSVPFVSDTQLRASLAAAGVPPETADTAVAINAQARLDGLRIALWGVVIFGIVALFFTGRIPRVQPGQADPEAEPDAEPADDRRRVPGPAAG